MGHYRPNLLLRQYRRSRHWSQQEFADAIRATAVRMGLNLACDEKRVGRWERGEVRWPQSPYRRVLQELTGKEPHELGFEPPQPDLDGIGHVPHHQEAAPVASVSAAEHPSTHEIPEEHAERTLLAMAARRAFQFATTTAAASNVGPGTLQHIVDEVTRLARAYPQQPLTHLLGDLVTVQDVAFRLLEGRQRPHEARDLYLMAGVVSGMLAKASHDMGDPYTAMNHARAAAVCAENAGHPGLAARVRGLQSLISYWAGWHRDAVRYAETGDDATLTGSVAAWLPALRARAWALLGNATETHAAIDQANAAQERATPDQLDEIGGLLTFSAPRQMYYAAEALVLLANAADAEHAAAAAVDAYEQAAPADRSFGDEAGARTDLAIARVRRGELEGAREALAPVLALPPEHRIHGVVVSAMRVHRAISRSGIGSPVGQEMQEEIEAFCGIPAAALPRKA